MFEIHRRDLVLGAVGSGLLFGLRGPVRFLSAAQARGSANFHHYKIGDIDAYSLSEGTIERPLEGFIKNAPLEEVRRAMSTNGVASDRYTNPFTPTALRIKGKLTLFDTGFGGFGPPQTGKLMSSMTEAGLDPKALDRVVISHFHPDHILGLWTKGSDDPVFRNIEIFLPEGEYKFWLDPASVNLAPENNRPLVRRLQAAFPSWKNVTLYKDGQEILPGVRAMSTPGHTPGHMSFLAASGNKHLFIQSDVTGTDRLFVPNPDWQSRLDMDGAMAAVTRRKFFERVVADGGMIAGYHFGFPSVGTIARDGSGYAFTPAAG